jgi:nucleotide-binding universal stress UspA family protein
MRHGAPPTTVLVPLDGSWRSETALVPAVPLARRRGARLALLSATRSAAELGITRVYLERRRAELFDDGFDGTCSVDAVVDRDAADAIVATSGEPGTLVCMATHGRGGVIRGVLGSVSEAVVRTGAAPVVLVGPALDERWQLPAVSVPVVSGPVVSGPDATVVLALDGSSTAREAVPAGLSLARAVDASVRIVHVARPDDAPVDDWERVVATFVEGDVDTSFEVVDGVDPAAAIADAAARHGATFVVAATHGRTGLARVTMGSVVQRIVRRSPCPVLVVRPLVLTTAPRGEGEAGAGDAAEEVGHARGGWRRDRGRPQPSGSAAP